MIEDFIKLNKYQKGIIISLLILSLSLIGFMFNSRVRLGEPQDDVPDIVIDDPKDIEDKDSENIFDTLFLMMLWVPIVYFAYILIWGLLDD